MSDSFYRSLRDGTAAPLIKQYGMSVTLRKFVKGTYNPTTGSRGADTYVDHPCFAISDNYKSYMIVNSLVRQGDMQLIVSAKELVGAVPLPGDQFILPGNAIWTIPIETGGKTSSFQPVQPISPGGIPVVYLIQIRQ